MKKVLIIAYAFPPMPYTGVYRTLRFCKHLPEVGWQPLVLTIKDYPYHLKDYTLLDKLPKDIKIYRTPTVDPAIWLGNISKKFKNLSSNLHSDIKKKTTDNTKNILSQNLNLLKRLGRLILHLLSFPDHEIFWIPFSVIYGIKIILKERPDIIYTSSPPHSTQLIGLILSKLFKKPWVADFRDPWVDVNNYSEQCFGSNTYMKIGAYLEALVMENATRVLMVSDLYTQRVKDRYFYLNQEKFQTITNGFDKDDLEGIVPKSYSKFTITFAGNFYSHIKPDLFLEGLKLWMDRKGLNNLLNKFQILFVGHKSTDVDKMIRERDLSNIVKCIDFVPKKRAIEICLASHVLLLVIGFNKGSDGILTSKIFDYILCKKPIFAIVPEGEAAELLRKSRTGFIVSEENPDLVIQMIDNMYREFLEKGKVTYDPDWNVIENYSALSLTERLSGIFDEIKEKGANLS